jgi:Domain of unknown function (DUF4294)
MFSGMIDIAQPRLKKVRKETTKQSFHLTGIQPNIRINTLTSIKRNLKCQYFRIILSLQMKLCLILTLTIIMDYLSRSIAALILLLLCVVAPPASAQARPDTTRSQGGWVRLEIINGDSVYVASMRTVKITGPRHYKDPMEREMLRRYRRYALHVYPYAVQAIDLYEETRTATLEMNRRERRKYTKSIKKEFKTDFEDELKKLYKTEGMILIKMIERQTGRNCYDILKETRGITTATYWNGLGKIWGYDLKQGYIVGQDPILDEVLLDFDFGEAVWKY